MGLNCQVMSITNYQCLLLETFFRTSVFFRINDVSDEVKRTTVHANGSVEGNLRTALRNFRESSVTRQNIGFIFISSK